MMTMKTWMFYASLAAAVCGGAGTGAYVSDAYFSPSAHDTARAIREAQLAALRACEMTQEDKAWYSGTVRNSPGKGF